jgi:hypothetical protein
MSTGQITRQIRNVTAAAALAAMTGCAAYGGGYDGVAYADPGYAWDGGYSVLLRDHWHSNHWQDHFDARAMHGGPHGGLAMAHFAGGHGGFGGGQGRG